MTIPAYQRLSLGQSVESCMFFPSHHIEVIYVFLDNAHCQKPFFWIENCHSYGHYGLKEGLNYVSNDFDNNFILSITQPNGSEVS